MSDDLEPRRPISLVGTTVQSNTTETFNYEVQTDATVERLIVNTHKGQQYDLQYTVTILGRRSNVKDVVTDIGDNNYLAGNGLTYDLEPREAIEEGDTIKIEVDNKDTSGNDYTTSLVMEIDRENNFLNKVLSSLKSII